ncbi:putative Ankyrin repeats (many copies) Ankyrin repeat Ankyrin repeats (3 copies) [Trypanosoma vivax]|uniref:Uncharacterized protein n=1 Tax=Trypanosoma vivax (strain Y486) TaxID=1055687 RepID=G0U6C1_TRYVY|nr:hypothetical protein TRVL_01352 [Trypanosoma vivax]KAH8611388.1 putative Ankyrin repeats (many copies) Ankyrin repeat Ankyrin repeats (3 copies) [Trypanosoma vivax]CCC51425.1 conserved hypothetical protein [Trypanosoma vivax Y486]
MEALVDEQGLNCSTANFHGSEAITLLSKRLARIENSVEELRCAEEKEKAELEQLIGVLNTEEVSVKDRLNDLESKKAALTDVIARAKIRLRRNQLTSEFQLLSWAELGLELLDLHTREEIKATNEKFVSENRRANSVESVSVDEFPVDMCCLANPYCNCRGESGSEPAVECEALCGALWVGRGAVLPDTQRLVKLLREECCDSGRVGSFLGSLDPSTLFSVLNSTDEDGNTSLHVACSMGGDAVAVAKLLLAAGANPSARNSAGRTPFHVACLNACDRRWRLKRLLLKNGCGVNERTDEGETAMHLCATDDLYIDTLRFLYSAGADLSAGAFFQGTWCTPIAVARAVGQKATRAHNFLLSVL